MLYIDNRNGIHLTRGDTARLTVDVLNEFTGENYEMSDGDTLRLTLRKRTYSKDIILQKVIDGSNTFLITPEDTSDMECTEYVYDVELTTADGDVHTVIGPKDDFEPEFVIMKEVTY